MDEDNLIRAIQNNNIEYIKFLIRNSNISCSVAILDEISKCQNLDILKLLLDGYENNIPLIMWKSAIHDNVRTIKLLLNVYGDKIDPHIIEMFLVYLSELNKYNKDKNNIYTEILALILNSKDIKLNKHTFNKYNAILGG